MSTSTRARGGGGDTPPRTCARGPGRLAAAALLDCAEPRTKSEAQRNIARAVQSVATQLGNTPASLPQRVHPSLRHRSRTRRLSRSGCRFEAGQLAEPLVGIAGTVRSVVGFRISPRPAALFPDEQHERCGHVHRAEPEEEREGLPGLVGLRGSGCQTECDTDDNENRPRYEQSAAAGGEIG